jgi:hypothetical protein
MDPDQIANALCWFCHGTAQITFCKQATYIASSNKRISKNLEDKDFNHLGLEAKSIDLSQKVQSYPFIFLKLYTKHRTGAIHFV